MGQRILWQLHIVAYMLVGNVYLSAQDNLLHIAHEYFDLAETFCKEKKFSKAIEFYKKAISVRPDYIRAYLGLGALLEKRNHDEQALHYYQQAAEINHNYHDVHRRIGHLFKKLGQFENAVTAYRHALACKANHTVSMIELANTLNILGHYEEALELYLNALEINPNIHVALYNFGFTLKKFGRIQDAITIHEKIIKEKPDYANAHFSLALSYLTIGNFEKGWQEHEWRWAAYNESPKKFDCPIWDGSNPAEKKIILYAEQGFGDTFQFVRYAQLLKKRGATVIVQTQNALATLLAQCPYIDTIINRTDPVPDADFHAALMSLPFLCKTRIYSVPTNIPYLHAKKTLVQKWHHQLATDPNFKIGICWQGNAQYRTPSLRQAVAAKSIPVNYFEPISQLPGISLYSLQKINGTEQLDTLNSFSVHTFGPDFDEQSGRFMDTAAIIKNLDLVITIDTAIAHLAGGLGVPVWVLLPQLADWRWLLERTDSPWYPTMRLFRQQKNDTWPHVIKQVTNALLQSIPSTQSKR